MKLLVAFAIVSLAVAVGHCADESPVDFTLKYAEGIVERAEMAIKNFEEHNYNAGVVLLREKIATIHKWEQELKANPALKSEVTSELYTMSGTVTSIAYLGNRFITERDELQLAANQLIDKANVAASGLKKDSTEEIALQTSINSLYGLLYEIVNVRDERELATIKEKFTPLQETTQKQIAASHN